MFERVRAWYQRVKPKPYVPYIPYGKDVVELRCYKHGTIPPEDLPEDSEECPVVKSTR